MEAGGWRGAGTKSQNQSYRVSSVLRGHYQPFRSADEELEAKEKSQMAYPDPQIS